MTKIEMLSELKRDFPAFTFIDTTFELYAKKHTKEQVERFCRSYRDYMAAVSKA